MEATKATSLGQEPGIAGRYRVLGEQNPGRIIPGRRPVLRVEHTLLGEEFLLRQLDLPGDGVPEARAGLLRRLRAVYRFVHAGVATVRDVGLEAERPFFVFDACPGVRLDELLATEGPPGAVRAAEIVRQLAATLAAAQRAGVRVSSLFLSDVCVERDPHGRPIVRIAELDLAAADPPLDHEVRACGAIFRALLAGTVPPPPPIAAVLGRALAEPRAGGYRCMDELLEALEALFSKRFPGLLRCEEPPPPGRPSPRRRAAALATALALGCTAVVCAVVAGLWA